MQVRGGGGIGSVRSPLFEKNCRNVLDWRLHLWICRSFPVCCYHTVILALKWHPSQLEIAVWRSSAGRCDKSPQRGIAVLCTDFCIFSHFFSLFLPISTGPRLGNSPVQSIVQSLARKDGTDDFYQLKVSTFFRPCLHGVNILGEHKWSGETDHHLFLAPNSCCVTICDRIV